ncbi:STAS domain-containing protein [Streptomyces sp. NPDC102467]|uniref:STAS domain-containing protein n=1 Tax=Streptomyces sp. NPDC102467 TaxID=3366179 RepID=UPI003828946D
MRGYFVDELLLITPLHRAAGVRLYGEVVGAHKASLAVAVTDYSRSAEEITVDLTQVRYLANSALETLVALARSLSPPQCLRVLAGPELRVGERLAAGGWDRIETLRLTSE